MVNFLELVHILQHFEMSSADIEVHNPIISLFWFLDTIKLQRIYNTLVFWAWNFVVKLYFFQAKNPIWLSLL